MITSRRLLFIPKKGFKEFVTLVVALPSIRKFIRTRGVRTLIKSGFPRSQESERDRQTDRQTDRQRERERERERECLSDEIEETILRLVAGVIATKSRARKKKRRQDRE